MHITWILFRLSWTCPKQDGIDFIFIAFLILSLVIGILVISYLIYNVVRVKKIFRQVMNSEDEDNARLIAQEGSDPVLHDVPSKSDSKLGNSANPEAAEKPSVEQNDQSNEETDAVQRSSVKQSSSVESLKTMQAMNDLRFHTAARLKRAWIWLIVITVVVILIAGFFGTWILIIMLPPKNDPATSPSEARKSVKEGCWKNRCW